MYEYKGEIRRVIDGDTIVVNIDLGWLTFLHDQHVRLFGLNCPEEPTAEGRAATVYTINWMNQHASDGQVRLQTRKSHDADKYGRWLAIVYAPDGSCLNNDLLASGHAVPMGS